MIYDFLCLIKISVKNVWRNRRRSIMTMASICIGTITLISLSGYVKVMDEGIKGQTINTETGHFQITRTGYFDEEITSMNHLVSENEYNKIIDKLYDMTEVDSITMRLHISGIARNRGKSTIFVGTCDQTESLVSMLPQVIEGEPLSPLFPSGIIVGRGIAKKLDVGTDDSLSLIYSTHDGSQETINVDVRGIYKGILKEQDNMIIYIPLETVWNLMSNKKVHRIIVFLRNRKDLNAVASEIDGFIKKHGINLEVKTWDEIAVMYKQIIGMFSNMVRVLGGIIFLVVIFSISNTMYMVVTDRIKEIGTLRAIGNTKSRIIISFLVEGLVIGIIAAAAGTVLSLILIPVINSLSLTLPPGPGQDDPIPIYLAVDANNILLIIAFNIITAASASILPAIKAARTKIADALRLY